MAVEIALLGEVTARVDGQPVKIGPARQRCALAALAVDAGRLVPVERLLERVWGASTPRRGRATLHSHISRLRRAFDDRLIVEYRSDGYTLVVDHADQAVDLLRFHAVRDLARTTDDDARRVALLTEALAQWRGQPLAGLSGQWVESERDRWQHERWAVENDLTDARLCVGDGAVLVAQLSMRTARYPLDERIAGQYMRALHRSGRTADALAHYRQLRERLVEELGTEPGASLAELHQHILNADRGLLPAGAPTRSSDRPEAQAKQFIRDHVFPVATPIALSNRNDLPGDIGDFTGRRTELAQVLTVGESSDKTARLIATLDGMAGTGKTTLAVHAAHRLAGRFPDAQLFIDLHGHTPGQPPLAPMAALETLLRSLGLSGEEIPNDLDARAARWRAESAVRTMLVVLDNAADTAQVRPLLAGTARTLTLITSRRRLVELESAHVVSLDVLPEDDAVNLFTGLVGADRVTGQIHAVHEVVRLCGHLPLAIRIAGARLRSRPAWTPSHLADRLRHARSPLAELSVGDRSVAAVFALSYEHLDERRQRLFRLLGVHPGADIDAEAAAALADMDPLEASRLLEGFVDDHLLQSPVAGRYRLHDLVRQHARALALTDEPGSGRRDALRRVIDFYLHTAFRGSWLLDKHYPPIDIGAPTAGCVPAALADDVAAMAWFDVNHDNIRRAQAAAQEAGWDTVVWRIAWVLDNFHYRRGHAHDNIASWLTGLAAAERLGDVELQARAHRRLGIAYPPLGDEGQAMALHHLERSLQLSEQANDVLGQAGVHLVLTRVWVESSDYRRALAHATRARNQYHELGASKWETRALNAMTVCCTRLGDHDQARDYCRSAQKLCRQHGDGYGRADNLDAFGAIAANTGQHTEALHRYGQALVLWQRLDNIFHQAGTLTALGNAHSALAQHDQARLAWQQAVHLYRKQNLGEAAARVEQYLLP